MPSLELVTNVKIDDPKAFVLELSKFGSEVLQKPEAYFTAQYNYNETISFAGTHDPAYNLRVLCLGLNGSEPERIAAYSKSISEWLTAKLGLANDRGYIAFEDPGNTYLGFKGTNFTTIFGKP